MCTLLQQAIPEALAFRHPEGVRCERVLAVLDAVRVTARIHRQELRSHRLHVVDGRRHSGAEPGTIVFESLLLSLFPYFLPVSVTAGSMTRCDG